MIICKFCNLDITPVPVIGMDEVNLIIDAITRHMRSAHQEVVNRQTAQLVEFIERYATIAAILFTLDFAFGPEVEAVRDRLKQDLAPTAPTVSN